jgi:uncharacterized protein (TIGR02145 family)
MKKLFIAFAFTSALFSCKKETTDTTKTNNDVSISELYCAGVKVAGNLIKDKVASNVSVTITYTGGNGKMYLTKSHSSSGVSGLSATLLEGSLAKGEGELVYTISGTPTTNGTANFTIEFGGKSCTITIPVDDLSQTIGKPGPIINDIEGNSYKTAIIGTQTWMAENLKTSKYNDGTIIPNVTNDNQWQNTYTGAWAYFQNNEVKYAKYGKLYKWYVVDKSINGNKNVCPTGWHVPTDAEWTVLTDFLGGSSVAGFKMKEVGSTNWNSPNEDATNTSLFTGLPGGYRNNKGYFYSIGNYGYWWSSSDTELGFAVHRYLHSNLSGAAYKGSFNKQNGLSVRCLKD